MSNLTPSPSFDSVVQLETTTVALGGSGAPMNLQAQALLNRTQYLYVRISALAPVASTGDYNSLTNRPALGSAAFQNSSAFATAAQGAKADGAAQISSLATVAFSGSYNDLLNKPPFLSDAPSDGNVYGRRNGAWVIVSGAGAGSVTSVALSAPSQFSVSGSPITGSGTINLAWTNQSANSFLAGPASGVPGAPGYRSIVAADLPIFVASGPSHAAGAVPDPGATAGTTRYLREDGTWAAPAGGSMPGASYAALQCALMEPDAIEVMQKDTFTYAIGSSPKYVTASWQTRLGSAGRWEVRDPARPASLKNVTLAGTSSGSCAIIIDPSIPSYSDPWATYYARKYAIDTSDTKTVAVTGNSSHAPFLPGAYGAIVTQITCFDLAWIIWRIAGTYGPNLANEISDTATQRVGNSLCLAINKSVAGEIESSASGSGLGSVSYVLLPSTWSVVPDPISSSYAFRDDFMGPSLDTTVNWTRVQSSAGNVEIDTNYQWCKMFGNSSWGANGILCKTSFPRSSSRAMVVDVFAPQGSGSTGFLIAGWSDGSAQAQSNFAHGINFAGSGIINVYENNTNRGTVGIGWTVGSIYRLRITLTSTGAKYEIQGGKEYPVLGGATWTDITPGTTSSATSTLYPAISAWSGNSYVSDVRVY